MIRLNKNILLVIDDAYFEYMKNKDYKSGIELFKNSKNVFILRTFSKIYGLASLRIGWGYGDKSIIKDRANTLRKIGMEKLKKHLTKKIGKKDLILIEKVQNENSIGKDQNFFNVIVNEKIKEGDIVAGIYTGISNDMLIAKRI